jgi:hypothetical protein
MDMENILGKVIGYKFTTQAEIRETYANLFEKALDCLVYVTRPVVEPLSKVIDKICEQCED